MAGFNHFSQIAAKLKPACQQVVTKTTLHVRDTAQSGASVETGFMRDAIYAVTPDGASTYGQASPTKQSSYLLPEVQPDNDTTGIVGCAANYSIYVEMGHHTRGGGSYVPAQPFFYPAVDSGRATFADEGANLEAYLK